MRLPDNWSELTKEQKLLWKIKNDREFYMKNFLKIKDKNANLIDFNINKAQRAFLDKIEWCEENNKLKRFIILKARQMGFSTFTEGLIFHDTSTTVLKNSLIIAHEEPATQNLFNMSKLYYEELPDSIKPMKKYANGKVLSFENPTTDDIEKSKNPGLRSKITVATAGTVEVGRSATYHNIHASEVAFFPDAKTTMLGLLQCVPDTMNSCVVLESTANGVGGYFYDIWQKATRGENEYIPLFFPWFFDPAYTRPFEDEDSKQIFINSMQDFEVELMKKYELTYEQMNWRRYTQNNKCGGDLEQFRQEYPSNPEEAFIASGRPRFSVPVLRQYLEQCEDGARYMIDDNLNLQPNEKGYVEIWKEPIPGEYYTIGADVAEGKIEGDYSVATVLDKNCDIVAIWYGHIDPDLFGLELVKLGKLYNEAYLAIESNNHGLTTIKAVQREEYYNIYYSKIYDRFADTITQKVGWLTSIKSKPMMIDKLAEYIREGHIGIKSKVFVMEMLTYIIEDKGTTNAQAGCHDDTVMSCAIALQAWLEGVGENYEPEESDKHTNTPKRKKDIGQEVDEDADPLFEGNSDMEVAD